MRKETEIDEVTNKLYGKSAKEISNRLIIKNANDVITNHDTLTDAIKNKKGFLYGIPIVVLASTYFIFANGLLQLLNMFVILALFVLMCMSVTETKMTENKFIRRFFLTL